MSTPKGVRSVNENIVQPGRAFIITDMTDIAWDQIPDGSLFINPVSGIMQVKLAGESTWTPAGIKNDGTLCIARDTSLHVETFTITSLDNGDGTFTYVNEDGEQRYKQFDNNGYIFELEHGSYIPGRNHLTVVLDDVLERSVVSGGIEELDSIRFKLLEKIPVGTELTVKYINWVRIGNPYPRVYEGYDDPEEAEIGDFFMDLDGTLDGLSDLGDEAISELRISWANITGKPTTVQGYGLREPFSYEGHTHTVSEISGLAAALANAIPDEIDATTLQGRVPDLEYRAQANTIAVYDNNGKLPLTAMAFARGMIMDWYGPSNEVPSGWHICDGTEGTPDLRNKFVICGSSYNTNTGQIVSSYGNNGGTNKQNITIGSANLPPHNHDKGNMNITGYFGAWNFNVAGGAFYRRSDLSENIRSGEWSSTGLGFEANRSWTGRTGSAYGNANGTATPISIDIMPPFVALFKIMYIGE